MKHFVLSIMLALCAFHAVAQDDAKVKIGFITAEKAEMTKMESSYVDVIGKIIRQLVNDSERYEIALNESDLEQQRKVDEYNHDYADEKLGKHTPQEGWIELSYSLTPGGEYRFTLERFSKNGANFASFTTEALPPFILEQKDDRMTEFVAYELVNRILGLSGSQVEVYNDLKAEKDYLLTLEADRIQKQREQKYKEYGRYTALSFLPPVNQFSSGTSRGQKIGYAIVSSYAVSTISFGIGTVKYSKYKRLYDGPHPDLDEAAKARQSYKHQMDIWQGVQIASAALFAVTYVCGVADALAFREAYNRGNGWAIAPVAYDNGAGLAFAYRF